MQLGANRFLCTNGEGLKTSQKGPAQMLRTCLVPEHFRRSVEELFEGSRKVMRRVVTTQIRDFF